MVSKTVRNLYCFGNGYYSVGINYIKQHKNAKVKDGIKQKPTEITPKTKENTAFSSAPTPKTKEQAIKDARKKYVSEKLKTKAEAEKSAR